MKPAGSGFRFKVQRSAFTRFCSGFSIGEDCRQNQNLEQNLVNAER